MKTRLSCWHLLQPLMRRLRHSIQMPLQPDRQ